MISAVDVGPSVGGREMDVEVGVGRLSGFTGCVALGKKAGRVASGGGKVDDGSNGARVSVASGGL